MKEINREDAERMKLIFVGNIIGTNLSQSILMVEGFKENNPFLYYSVDLIAVHEETHNGQFVISFWK